ncbi:HAD-IA family hydrolase [Bosea sp. (in: a-proteobacteria)]|uniref:HAD-IA family hydrolase n=1 Tax=Bosea sp. (in: a-proteobacteria) TaxID=1871050 RepID=UPI003F721A62
MRALMVDVDGVLVRGRPSDGSIWSSRLESDLGLSVSDLNRAFFAPHWHDVIIGRIGLSEALAPALKTIAPHLRCDELIAYWFENDSRLDLALLDALADCRAAGLRVCLATNQEHLRAGYLMDEIGLATHVDGMFYSAAMGCKKPDLAFFTSIVSQTGLAPGEILLIDDMQGNVDAARTAGWHALHWDGRRALQDALAPFGLSPRFTNPSAAPARW